MMTAQGKCRDYCCPGHSPKALNHGSQRAHEYHQWILDADRDLDDGVHPRLLVGPFPYRVSS
ncbi:hypothetical protein ABH941_005913 [Streptacidiphilus sp. EB103A]